MPGGEVREAGTITSSDGMVGGVFDRGVRGGPVLLHRVTGWPGL